MDIETDVAIVGAGPSGLTLSLLLARSGVRSVLVERRQTRSNHPRAHFVNTRTMELFSTWGLAEAIEREAYPGDCLPFDMLEAFGGDGLESRHRLSPGIVRSCAQDRVEEVLLSEVEQLSEVQLLWGHTFAEVDDLGDEVVLRAEGPDGEVTVTARFLVASDGANSPVRTSLGIEMIGDHDLGHVVNTYFFGRITPEEEAPPMVMLAPNYQEVPGAFICMDGDRRWCLHLNYDHEAESIDDFTPERCADLVRRAANLPATHPIDIQSIRPWTMTAHVAERLRVGNVFLVGDAAHAFPPTGGFGMNSGIQDAHNLAWKLTAVLRAQGGEALLDSYEAERQPVAFFNSAQSLRNARTSRRSPESPEVEEDLGRRGTKTVRSGQLSATDPEERGKLEMLEHASSLGQELGFAYDQSPIIVDDGRERPDIQVHKYIPNACPGARAPHLPVERDGCAGSILAEFEGHLSLLTLPDGHAWRDAATQVEADIKLVTVGAGQGLVADEAELAALYDIEQTGAVLVRPDGHVAFRAANAAGDPESELRHAVQVATGHMALKA